MLELLCSNSCQHLRGLPQLGVEIGSVDVALGYIRKLYGIEKRAKTQQLHVDQLVALRHKEVKPLLDKFRKWLENKSLQVVPKSLLGKAVSYTLYQWPRW